MVVAIVIILQHWLDRVVGPQLDRLFPPGIDGINTVLVMITFGILMAALIGIIVTEVRKDRAQDSQGRRLRT